VDHKQLLELIKSKDQKGYESLYSLYADKFFGYAVKKWLFSEDDAMNVVYQTLETLVLKISSYEFESKAHFENFIFKVFINFLRQQFRQNRKKQQEVSFTSLSEAELDNQGEPMDFLKIESSFSSDTFNEYYQTDTSDNPKLILLQKALEQLEKSDKELLLLRAQNFTYDEIAAMLKIENNQLKVKHHRAKARLLKLLEQIK
jgi:RNA polymerase sigma factor (sigma-70 family)